jgi:hypothetical protein
VNVPLDINLTFDGDHVFFIVGAIVRTPELSCFLSVLKMLWNWIFSFFIFEVGIIFLNKFDGDAASEDGRSTLEARKRNIVFCA